MGQGARKFDTTPTSRYTNVIDRPFHKRDRGKHEH